MEIGKKNGITKHKNTITSANSYDTSSSSQGLRGSKKKSKISSRIGKLEEFEFLENYKDLLYSPHKQEDNEDYLDDTQKIIIYNPTLSVKVNLYLEIEKKELFHSLNMKLSENIKISEITKMAVDQINDYFAEENLDFFFKPNYQEYELRPSKKNGRPKMDLPAISNEATVKDTYIDNFSLRFKEENLIKKTIKKKGKCSQCLIM